MSPPNSASTIGGEEPTRNVSLAEQRTNDTICSNLRNEHGAEENQGPDALIKRSDEAYEDPLTAQEQLLALKRNSFSAALRSLRPSLSAGVSRKASAGTFNSWVSLALTLDGRDKITKVLQYSARMMAWWCQSGSFRAEHALRFKALQASLTKSRKAYRLGRSLVEVEKIRKVGALALLKWYLQRALNGPSDDTPSPIKSPAWKVFGAALKMVGLFGFWAADNVSFIASSGFLDDYSLESKERGERRSRMSSEASRFAARSYFAGCIAGLATAARSYWMFQRDELKPLQEQMDRIPNDDGVETIEFQKVLEDLKRRQFDLFIPLLKSCCDVIVFSNTPGVDLHKRFRGKKMHEGFHCLCGLISASTVLYTNYPDADP